MKKVLVTGASGFIGNHVINELLKTGCHVIATSANEEKAGSLAWFNKVKYIAFDLKTFNNNENYFSFFDRPDVLIHLAWEGLPNYTNNFHLDENLPRHKAFLKNIIANGLKDISITGTCFEYGMQEGCLNENMEAKPANAYATAKNELRKWLEQMQAVQMFQLKWIRLFYMYGVGQNANSLLSQLERALVNGDAVFNMSGGEQVRDYLPIEKVAAYIVKIALQNNVSGIINCCSGNGITVKKFVEDYLKESNKKIDLNLGFYPYASYEPMYFWGDNTKLKTIIGNE